MSRALLPAAWRVWLLQQVERGCKPADLLRQLTVQGHLTAHSALLAIDEALHETARASAAHGGPRPRLDTQRRLLDAADRQVCVRAALESPGVAVLDHLLDDTECSLLCAWAECRERRDGTPHPVLDLLAVRLGALVNWPVARFSPLQIRRLQQGESCRPGAARPDPGATAGARGGAIVGSFVVYLNAPMAGGAACLPGAPGLRVLPHAGTAIWFNHQGPGSAGPAALQAAHEPPHAEQPWVVAAWLNAQAWHAGDSA